MTTLEKIRAEIEQSVPWNTEEKAMKSAVLDVIDKYAEQEPCDDVVSRQAIKKLKRHNLVEGQFVSLYDIEKLPSVRPQEPKWISVSERLPEDGQSVLFCDIDNDIMVGYHVKGRPNTHFSQDGTWEDMKNVEAWMPLPTPYEPQESEDKE